MAVITIFVFGKTEPLIVLAIFGGSLALVFLAALIVFVATATYDPRIHTIVERKFDSALRVVGVKPPSTGIDQAAPGQLSRYPRTASRIHGTKPR